MADDVVLDVLIELKQEGLEVVRLISQQLRELNDQVKDVNQSLERMSDRLHADTRAMLELAGATAVAKGSAGGAGILGFISSLAALMPGGTAMGYAILGVLGLAAVLAPLAYAFLAVTANAVAWTAIAGVAVSAIVGLAGAIFLLGAANAGGLNPAQEMIKTQKALETAVKEHIAAQKELLQVQQGNGASIYGPGLSQKQMLKIASTYVGVTGDAVSDAQRNLAEPMSGLGGPIAKLGTALDDMHDHFERASRALADHIALWAMRFLPAIQNAGDALLKWFGQRAPLIFATLTNIVQNVMGFMERIGATIGKVVDYFLAHRAEVDAFWKAFLGGGAAAFDGFMNAMMNIADWFRKNWPAISKAAGDTWAGIKQGWDLMWPSVHKGLDTLHGLLDDVIKNLGDLKPLLPAVGVFFGALALGVESVVAPVLELVSALEKAVALAQWLAGNSLGSGSFKQNSNKGPGGAPTFVPNATTNPGIHPTSANPQVQVMPIAFVTIPPSREQALAMNTALRQLNVGLA